MLTYHSDGSASIRVLLASPAVEVHEHKKPPSPSSSSSPNGAAARSAAAAEVAADPVADPNATSVGRAIEAAAAE